MEIPYTGRAIVTDSFDHIKIVVPTKRNIAILAFLAIWICGWGFMGYPAGLNLLGNGINQLIYKNTSQTVWVCAWILGLIFAIRTILWMFIGKEIITAGQGVLTISKNLKLINRSRAYDMNEATNFYVRSTAPQNKWCIVVRDESNSYNIGTIHFDYGMKTISFAEGIDEAEANYLLRQILEKGMPTKYKF